MPPYRILSPLDFVYKARQLVSGGNYRAALQELTTAIEMDPTLIDAYVERGAMWPWVQPYKPSSIWIKH